MAPLRRSEPNADEPHSWREYRLKLLDLVEKHDIEIARLHDAHLELQVLQKARSAGWGWIGAIFGTVAGGLITTALIKLFHL